MVPTETAPTSLAVGICINLPLSFKPATPFAWFRSELAIALTSCAVNVILPDNAFPLTVVPTETAPMSLAVGICCNLPLLSSPAIPFGWFFCSEIASSTNSPATCAICSTAWFALSAAVFAWLTAACTAVCACVTACCNCSSPLSSQSSTLCILCKISSSFTASQSFIWLCICWDNSSKAVSNSFSLSFKASVTVSISPSASFNAFSNNVNSLLLSIALSSSKERSMIIVKPKIFNREPFLSIIWISQSQIVPATALIWDVNSTEIKPFFASRISQVLYTMVLSGLVI